MTTTTEASAPGVSASSDTAVSDNAPSNIEDAFNKLPDDAQTTTVAVSTDAPAETTTLEDAFSKYASYGADVSPDNKPAPVKAATDDWNKALDGNSDSVASADADVPTTTAQANTAPDDEVTKMRNMLKSNSLLQKGKLGK